MAKQQGKVKAIPVKEVTEGMQVMWEALSGNLHYGIVERVYTDNIVSIKNLSTNGGSAINRNSLKTLVVEYEEGYEDWQGDNETGQPIWITNTKQLPLKYSQWQSAIDNGEVDSDKVVEFEKINDINVGKSYISYVKIIPQKKRIYSEEDMEEAFKAGRECNPKVFPFRKL